VNLLTQIVITLMSAVPALLIAYLAYRSSKATATAAVPVATVETGPSAQAQINAGFTLIMNQQQQEIVELRGMVRKLTGYTKKTSRWHVEHVQDFDGPAKDIILRTAPTELINLKLVPFPAWEDERD
jgi:hypothetical protein